MNEAKTVYIEEQKEKNALAVSGRIAAHKTHPCSGKTKHTLADIDYVNVTKPITYKKFKNLPTSMQKIYLDTIISRFNPSARGISYMLGISTPTMYGILKEHGISFAKKKHDDSAFNAWIHCSRLDAEEIPNGENRCEEAEPVAEPISNDMTHITREIVLTEDIVSKMTMHSIGELVSSIVMSNGNLMLTYEERAK